MRAATSRLMEVEHNADAEKQTYQHKIHQLQIYNHELETQFNTQMDMLNAVKKKYIAVRFCLQSF